MIHFNSGLHSVKKSMEAYNMQTILHNCCGLDVHKDSIVACILKTSNVSSDSNNEEVETEIRVFETFPDALKELKSWLESED